MTSRSPGQAGPPFEPIAGKMKREGIPPLVIESFRRHYVQLVEGATGLIGRDAMAPLDTAPDLERIGDLAAHGKKVLGQAVIIKLNGGLGTSMGLERAKSVIEVREGLTFLDVIIRQVLVQRGSAGVPLPLVFMNSFSTEEDARAVIGRYPQLAQGQGGVPFSFLQYKVPKIRQDNFGAVTWPADPSLEWYPPGHGEIYTALVTRGVLEALLKGGFRYAFVSNADNLSAVPDLNILGYFAQRGLPFLMEVADRTEADRKGGHVARRKDGRLVLRESAQCPQDELADFQDVTKYKYFNTNNLWIDLGALAQVLETHGSVLDLSLIRNSKTVDPRDENSPAVYHLETAMGSAISVFEGAGVLRVPRGRFTPVKTTEDLLALHSDLYFLDESMRLAPNPARKMGAISIQLDSNFYRRLDDFEARFPHGPPSLVECEGLVIEGDVRFGKDVALHGRVELRNEGARQMIIPDGEVIEGSAS